MSQRLNPSEEQLLSFFRWEHLPEHLQSVSKMYGELALSLIDQTSGSAERTVALRKLLESKDAAVRAKLLSGSESYRIK